MTGSESCRSSTELVYKFEFGYRVLAQDMGSEADSGWISAGIFLIAPKVSTESSDKLSEGN